MSVVWVVGQFDVFVLSSPPRNDETAAPKHPRARIPRFPSSPSPLIPSLPYHATFAMFSGRMGIFDSAALRRQSSAFCMSPMPLKHDSISHMMSPSLSDT